MNLVPFYYALPFCNVPLCVGIVLMFIPLPHNTHRECTLRLNFYQLNMPSGWRGGGHIKCLINIRGVFTGYKKHLRLVPSKDHKINKRPNITEVGNVTSKRNCVTRHRFSHVLKAITIKAITFSTGPKR